MKEKKKNLVMTLALVCALAALALSALCFGSIPEDQSHLIDDLYAENARLQGRVEELEGKLDQLMTAASLRSWTLDVAPWPDSTGADVTLSAVPSAYQPDFRAELIVVLDGNQVARQECQWDAGAFAATASLDAADGYSYYCDLTTPAGSQRLMLTGPDSSEAGTAVYLGSSLSAYCNLVVNNWSENSGESLTLTAAYAQVQLPRISADGAVEIVTAELVLRLNGADCNRIPIQLTPSEVEGSLELTITDLKLPMPELQEGDALELCLEVTLTDGRHMNAFGISWRMEQGRIASAVG